MSIGEFNKEIANFYGNLEPVCAGCFEDEDLKGIIRDYGGPPGCDFCGGSDAPTAPLQDIAEFMRSCLREFYGFADDQLPYETREGGYQGAHWDTHDLLFDQVGLELPRDSSGRLMYQLAGSVGEEVWCEFDWLSLDYDVALRHAWNEFCEVIKHRRRFFFALEGEVEEDMLRDRDRYSPLALLHEVCKLVEEFSLVRRWPAGMKFFRARPCSEDKEYNTAQELGPPPAEVAVQANRMNPAGIPMMYGAETEELAVVETRSSRVSVGRFNVERAVRILDLVDLPEIPGLFSGADRFSRLGLIFIHAFRREIVKPVDRTDRIHVDYIPSQVVTEYIRGNEFQDGVVHGIRYPSALQSDGRNLVLFATQEDLSESDGTPVVEPEFGQSAAWIRLEVAHTVKRED